ncbi:hypothetical protein ACFVYA_24475 [Amycolatopsis sp. NPDC058278]|uniref:hypothetical protein n=1 Tax=Amycolatopsis sp. NPDC058278 TaxID=3346417 RepID=UPI0036D7C5C7
MTRQPDHHKTLSEFVLRARRIQAHSLVADWEKLIEHASGSFTARMDVTGAVTFVRQLPPDEEVFESLAARVRPLTITSEPIHHEKVIIALKYVIEQSGIVNEQQQRELDALARAWEAVELQGVESQAYSMQLMRPDGSDASPLVSDTQLAAAWLYADLVHADPRGPKQQAMQFPLRERYAAAVRYFSNVAALAVSTLRFVEELRDAGVITIDGQPWEQDVSIGVAELREEVRLLVAPVGTAMPDLRQMEIGLGEEWQPLTLTDLLRHTPTNHVEVVLADADGSVLATYAAAVAHRHTEGNVMRWDVLVAGCVMFKFSFEVEESRIRPINVELLNFDSTNQLMMADAILQLQMHHATTMQFNVHGQTFVSIKPFTLADEQLAQTQVSAEVLSDIIAIEAKLGEQFAPCHQSYDDGDRVELRCLRLMYEGEIVRSYRNIKPATVPSSTPPQVIVIAPRTFTIGGTEIPAPQVFLRHPEMTFRELELVPSVGPEARKFEVAPPTGERFFAWSPHFRRDRHGDFCGGRQLGPDRLGRKYIPVLVFRPVQGLGVEPSADRRNVIVRALRNCRLMET